MFCSKTDTETSSKKLDSNKTTERSRRSEHGLSYDTTVDGIIGGLDIQKGDKRVTVTTIAIGTHRSMQAEGLRATFSKGPIPGLRLLPMMSFW